MKKAGFNCIREEIQSDIWNKNRENSHLGTEKSGKVYSVKILASDSHNNSIFSAFTITILF